MGATLLMRKKYIKMVITETDFKEQVKKTGSRYWDGEGNYNRWLYYKEAAEVTKKINPASVLEAGTMGVRVFLGSDTINYSKIKEWEIKEKDTYWHDLAVTPYPINKRYDLFIAMRVMHRIGVGSDTPVDYKAVFNEIRRICKSVLIAVPENWGWEVLTDIKPEIIYTKRISRKKRTCIYLWT